MKRVTMLAALGALSLAACTDLSMKSQIHVDGSVLTSSISLAQGKTTPANAFQTDESIRFITHFSWLPVKTTAGIHVVDFKWYKDDKIISDSPARMNFNSTPYSVWSTRSAFSLGVGHFRVETWVDNQKAGQADFDVHA